jgi:hypothetical protein
MKRRTASRVSSYRCVAQVVDAAVDVAVLFLVVPAQRVDDLPRLLAGRRAVEVDEPFPPRADPENGKVGPDSLYIERWCDFGKFSHCGHGSKQKSQNL